MHVYSWLYKFRSHHHHYPVSSSQTAQKESTIIILNLCKNLIFLFTLIVVFFWVCWLNFSNKATNWASPTCGERPVTWPCPLPDTAFYSSPCQWFVPSVPSVLALPPPVALSLASPELCCSLEEKEGGMKKIFFKHCFAWFHSAHVLLWHPAPGSVSEWNSSSHPACRNESTPLLNFPILIQYGLKSEDQGHVLSLNIIYLSGSSGINGTQFFVCYCDRV